MLYNLILNHVVGKTVSSNFIEKAKLRISGIFKYYKMYNNPGYGGYYSGMMQGPPMPFTSGVMHNPGMNQNAYLDSMKRPIPNFLNRNSLMDGLDGPKVRKVVCGELRLQDAGCNVEISGRLQNQRLHRFLSLRDESGTTQLVVPEDRDDLQRRLRNMPMDSFMVLRGIVTARPAKSRNEKMATGDIEVVLSNFVTVHPKRKKENSDSEEDDSRHHKKKVCSDTGTLKLTTEELSKCPTPSVIKHFSQRTHTTNDLGKRAVGQTVILCGWLYAKRVGGFAVLKDGYGTVQVVPSSQNSSLAQKLSNLNVEDIIVVTGIVSRRPPGHENHRVENGNIEVLIDSLKIVNPQDPAPPGEEDDGDPPCRRKKDVPQEIDETNVVADANKYSNRSHTCGELNEKNVGQNVRLMGWLAFSRMDKFALLRDGYGETQLLIPDGRKDLQDLLGKTALESALLAEGTVCSRPPGQENLKQATGRIEIAVTNLKILNESKEPLPFNVNNIKFPTEILRLQHRYLDLRHKNMQNNLRLRSKFVHRIRKFLIEQLDFVEVETPTLFKRTPGGAQEFVVPTRQKDEFFSLVQSPQQFKQLLMVGSIDRYFQIARCYRDESGSRERQPEFTQLDIELSFCNSEDIINLIEELLQYCWPDNFTPLNTPFPRISYNEAMNLYGTDKPDLRFDWKLSNISDIFLAEKNNCKGKINISELVESEEFGAFAFVARKGGMKFSESSRKEFQERMKSRHPDVTPFFINVKDVNKTGKQLQDLFNSEVGNTIKNVTAYEAGDVLFLGLGPKESAQKLLGKARVDFADFLEENKIDVIEKDAFNFLWVVDFPLFVKNENGDLETAHHPFTRPRSEDLELLEKEPLKVKGLHYDLVLNGNEIGGGSIRIHESELQKKILENILKINPESLSHLLRALDCGAPPHGGIALGLDRLIAIICNAHSIRDVIAFPKTGAGADAMSGAPCPISDEEKKLYHLN